MFQLVRSALFLIHISNSFLSKYSAEKANIIICYGEDSLWITVWIQNCVVMEGKYSCLDANKYLLSRGQSPLQRHLILGSNLEEGRNEICQGYQKLTTIQLLYRYTSFPTLARKVNSTEGLSIPLQIFQITWQVLFLFS